MMQLRFWFLTFVFASSAYVHAENAKNSVYQKSVLPNGMQLVVVEQPKVPLVTIVLSFKAGSRTETDDLNGLTHVWEHMFFKGNKALPSEDAFQKRVRQLGIQYNGVTSVDYVQYFFTMPSAYLDEGIQFMADAIKSPLLASEDLKKERVVVLDEYDRNASQPGFDLIQIENHVTYGNQQHRRNPLGKRSLIENIDTKKLYRIRSEVFVPQNAALLLSGDVSFATASRTVEKAFSSWKAPKNWKPVQLPAFPEFPKTTRIVMGHKDAQNVAIKHCFAGPSIKDAVNDTIVADVFVGALGNRGGRFYKTLVDSGLSLEAGLGFSTEYEVAELNLYGVSTAKNAQKVEQALLAEIPKWTDPQYFTDEQIADVHRSMLIDHKRLFNKPSQFVMTLAFWWAISGLDYFDSYLDRLKGVSKKDIVAFVNRYLINHSHVTTVLANKVELATAGLQDNSQEFIDRFGLKRTNP